MVKESAVLVIPSTVDSLPLAVALLGRTGAKLDAALRGANAEEEVVLFGRFGKSVEENDPFVDFEAALAEGLGVSAAFTRTANPASRAVIRLSEALQNE